MGKKSTNSKSSKQDDSKIQQQNHTKNLKFHNKIQNILLIPAPKPAPRDRGNLTQIQHNTKEKSETTKESNHKEPQ